MLRHPIHKVCEEWLGLDASHEMVCGGTRVGKPRWARILTITTSQYSCLTPMPFVCHVDFLQNDGIGNYLATVIGLCCTTGIRETTTLRRRRYPERASPSLLVPPPPSIEVVTISSAMGHIPTNMGRRPRFSAAITILGRAL